MTDAPDDFTLFAGLSARLETEYVTGAADDWENSPFNWIRKTGSSRRRGAIGEKLVHRWCELKGFEVQRSPQSDADRLVNGIPVEIKFSTPWQGGGYRFQQVREQAYDYMFCLGISPAQVHAWFLPKALLREHVIGHLGQHTGAEGADTAWFGFLPDEPLEWMKPWGGGLAEVDVVMRRELGVS